MLAAVLILSFMEKHQLRNKLNRFAGREDMNIHEFYKKYYIGSNLPFNIVKDILHEVSMATEIPAEKLRPTDRFDKEFLPATGWEFDDGIYMLVHNIKQRLKKSNNDIDWDSLETLDNFILTVGPEYQEHV